MAIGWFRVHNKFVTTFVTNMDIEFESGFESNDGPKVRETLFWVRFQWKIWKISQKPGNHRNKKGDNEKSAKPSVYNGFRYLSHEIYELRFHVTKICYIKVVTKKCCILACFTLSVTDLEICNNFLEKSVTRFFQ